MPHGFEKPSEALRYLKRLRKPPHAYFVDMKPYQLQNIDYNRPEQFPELKVPEELFHFVAGKGWPTKYFYFMTQYLSSHDSEVLARTNANSFTKPLLKSRFVDIINGRE